MAVAACDVKVGSGGPMVNNPSGYPAGAMDTVSAGPEVEVRTARGAMLYDGSCIDQPGDSLFERAYWQSRGVLRKSRATRLGRVHPRRRPALGVAPLPSRRLPARFVDDTYLWTGADRTRSFAEWRLLRRLREWELACAAAHRRPLHEVGPRLPRRSHHRGAAVAADAGAGARCPAARSRRLAGRRTLRRTLHSRGVRHADLNAHKPAARCGRRVYVLDFDRGRIESRGDWEQHVIERLRRSLEKVSRDLPAGRFDDGQWNEFLKGVAACARLRPADLPAGAIVIALEGWKAFWNPEYAAACTSGSVRRGPGSARMPLGACGVGG